MTFNKEAAFVQRTSNFVWEVFSAEVALDLPVIKVATTEKSVPSDSTGVLSTMSVLRSNTYDTCHTYLELILAIVVLLKT